MEHIDLLDERHAKLYEEIQSCMDEDEEYEVFVFDHEGGYPGHEIHTRTAVIDWGPNEFLIIQSHYLWGQEGEVRVVRLPHAAVKFMAIDILAQIKATGFKVSLTGHKEMKYQGWKEGF